MSKTLYQDLDYIENMDPLIPTSILEFHVGKILLDAFRIRICLISDFA